MRIRKAKMEDFKQYLELRKENLKEYSKIIDERIKFTNNKIKREFGEIISSSKRFLLVSKDNKRINGYLMGTLFSTVWKKSGYIDDIFVLKEFRKKGIGILLVKEFIKLLKIKKAKSLKLGVNPKNKNALRMYNKLGFKITHYEMDKKI